ncbi:RBBP8 N-terminal-like protein isoform X1 [Oryzias melastigma]|uniref:Retinoblastoma binding protein 8-like n=1 Tax=Oryzias melastigma TaxID=30732 RepID=A0A3B3DC74_ORYME|nr:RBBP8 N-terminal-like protein isoform X1 [Oryzias melastigma]XP_024147866.1 RBBP8 N-terminal-like protein isoform X1 [Oryzias melastigma]
MESFSDMLRKLQEAHEREVEGWQGKVRELSNKKGCDSKRMEELFNRNQQMKEQQRMLTENIRTLENRLRAGLCDRCTVTQEVAKRRQQEFEASQIQSLQHISILAGEMTNLKKEILKLKDENRSLRAALNRGSADLSSSAEHKTNGSPDQSPRSRSINLISPTPSRTALQPADGDVVIKVEADQRREEIECRELKGSSHSSFEVVKPRSSPAWRTDSSLAQAAEKRAQSIEVLDQHPGILLQPHRRNSSPVSGVEVKPRRPVVPIPCHPQPINSSSVSLPWALSESSNWANVAAMVSNRQMPNSSRLQLPHFPNLIAPPHQLTPRKHGFSPSWHKHSIPQHPSKEPTMVCKFRDTKEHADNIPKPPEKKDPPPYKAERVPREVTRDAPDGPLDLSDRGKLNPNQKSVDEASQGEGRVQGSSDEDGRTRIPASPSSLCGFPSSHSAPQTQKNHESEHKNGVTKEQEQKEEVMKRTEQSNAKKVPLSLRPAVVMLETLNSALQKQESLSSNGKLTKMSSPANVVDSSSDEQDENLSSCARESAPNGKRKRTTLENETDRDTDKNNIQPERRIKIRLRPEERSPS